MDWYQAVFELIDMRSFSNLWYWIALAVLWSTASHWVLGVPFDMVHRAGRDGGQAEDELADFVRINVSRILYVADRSGHWLIALTAAGLTVLITLGFFYDVEFAQAVFFLIGPMAIIGGMTVLTCRRIRKRDDAGEALRKTMSRHRLATQIIGVISIFITALWGMAQNLLVTGPLGG
ncbi:MAG: component of SufBCD complex [Pseudomonadota bacterium]